MDKNRIYNMDCLEGMQQIEKNSVDLIVTDPPFTFGIGSSINNSKLDNWSDLLNGASFFRDVFMECKRVCKPDAGMWIFNSYKSLPCLMKALSMCELNIESLLVWYKDWIGPGGQKGLRPSYEVVALVCLGEWGLKNRNIRDVQTFPWSSHKPNHPAEKPLKLVRWLIEISEGQVVLDPFMGSGTTAVAAKEMGRDYIGFELNPQYFEVAVNRLNQHQLGNYEPQKVGLGAFTN